MSEIIEWHRADDALPDAEETVLLLMQGAAGDPVWPGYFDYYGDQCWLLADGTPAGNVTHWAAMPEGPRP